VRRSAILPPVHDSATATVFRWSRRVADDLLQLLFVRQ